MSRRTLLALIWLLVPGTTATQQAPVASQDVSGSVSGHVVSNYGGIVADATVTLSRVETGGTQIDPLITKSDRQGSFRFERIAPGRYRLAGSKPGYTNRSVVLTGTIGSTGRTASARIDSGVELTVGSGQGIADRDVSLRRAGSIAGRVAEPDGIPAPDVHVFAAIRREFGYTVLPETRTTSAWDGRYEITDLPAGNYLVVAQPIPSGDPSGRLADAERRAPEAPVSSRPSFAPTLYPGVTDVERAIAVALLEGVAVEGIDVWLTPPQRFAVSGRISWPDDVSVENVAIEYTSVAAQRSGLWIVSDPGGLFTITGVPEGTFVLVARADSNRGPLAGIASTNVSIGDVDDVRLTLVKPGAIEGRLVYETDVPVSSRPKTLVLKQTLVRVSPLYPAPESTIGPDGRFRLERALGEYDFELRGLPPGLRITRVMRQGRQVPNGHIGVAAGEVIGDIEVFVGR